MAKVNKSNIGKNSFPNVLKECMGLVSKACEKVNVSRTTYYQWRKDDPEFAAICDEVQEHVGDFVESKLMRLINEENPTAILFYCKTKLKNRGYVERVETTGKDGAAVEMNVNFRANQTDERILEEYKNMIISGQSSL